MTTALSVVVPTYGCAACLGELYRRLVEVLTTTVPTFEIIFVCDGSPDECWSVVQELAAKDTRVVGVEFSRNFGQHTAILAGTDYARGETMVVMDCDLQHDPASIPRMLETLRQGYDVVMTRRVNRKDALWKRLTSRVFVAARNWLSGVDLDPGISNFSIVDRKVIVALRSMRERSRSYAYFLAWLGFKTAIIDVDHHERFAGESSYSMFRLIRHASESIVAASDLPLRLSIRAGLFMSGFAALWAVWLIIRYFWIATPPEGWTSVMVALFFLSGLVLFNMGVVGLYVGRIFEESKRRPLYVVRDSINAESNAAAAGARASTDVTTKG